MDNKIIGIKLLYEFNGEEQYVYKVELKDEQYEINGTTKFKRN